MATAASTADGACLKTAKNSSARASTSNSAGPSHRAADQTTRIGQQSGISIAEAVNNPGRVLDVGEQERHCAGGQGALALAAELAVHEADRHDPVLLGGLQEPPPGAIAGIVVLELHLVESGQGVANVRFVVDRQPPPTPGIDVGEGAVAQRPALPGAESVVTSRWYRSRWVVS